MIISVLENGQRKFYWLIDPGTTERIEKPRAPALRWNTRGRPPVFFIAFALATVFAATLLTVAIIVGSQQGPVPYFVLSLLVAGTVATAMASIETRPVAHDDYDPQRRHGEAHRILHLLKTAERIPISSELARILSDPDALSLAGEITSMLVDNEVAAKHRLLDLPADELSNNQREELRGDMNAIEHLIQEMIEAAKAHRKRVEVEEVKMLKLQKTAAKAGNDAEADLLLRKRTEKIARH